jgi:RNA recognition motif-containing protein
MSKKLFVGGLSWNTTEEILKETFSTYGTVLSAVIVLDKETRKSRGFGFVGFSSEEEAQAALAGLDGSSLDRRTIHVKPAIDNRNGERRNSRDRSPRNSSGGYRGSQGDNRNSSGGYRNSQGGYRSSQGDNRSSSGGYRNSQGGNRNEGPADRSNARSNQDYNRRDDQARPNRDRPNTSRPPRDNRFPKKDTNSFGGKSWGGGDAMGEEDKWGKDRSRRREGKKKKTQYKKQNKWDDWDDE